METRNEISEELRALSELLSGISRQVPYVAPDGYFDQLPIEVMSRIGRIADQSLTFNKPQTPAFSVPEGYFEGFAAQVLAQIKTEASAELSPVLATLRNKPTYRVPDGYFEALSPVLAILKDKSTYQVPADYFEELSPVLTILRNKSTYQVPAGYFEELAAEVSAKTEHSISTVHSTAIPAKVIPIGRNEKVLKGNWWKYSSVGAVAACLILIFSWPQLNTEVMHTSKGQVSGIENSKKGDLAQSLHNVSDQEIQTYMDDQSSILSEPITSSTATLDMNEGDVKNLLGEVPDNELQQYMEEHGKADDIATN